MNYPVKGQLIKIVLLTLLLSSCAMGPRVQNREPAPAPHDAVELFNSIDLDLETGAKAAALRKLKRIVKNYPNSDISDDAYLKLGDLYFSAQQYDAAFRSYAAIYNSPAISPLVNTARIKAARSLLLKEDFTGTLSLTDELIEQDLDDKTMTEAYKIRLDALARSGKKLETLRSLTYLSTQSSQAEKRTSYRATAIEMVETQLSDQELSYVSRTSEFGFLRAYALFRQGELQKEQKDYAGALNSLLSVKELLPASDLAERADLLIGQIDSLKKVDHLTIGAVLPLTGKHSAIAHRVLRGLQMGLGIYGDNPSSFRLAVVDSEGNPDIARRAVERLVTEDHVIAIVGSLLSKTSVAVASKSSEMGVASIGLSQRAGITDTGEDVFRNSVTTEMLIQRLVRTAMSDLEIKKFAVLYPNDAYGVAFANHFWDEVLRNGGEIRAIQPYASRETDFQAQVQRLVGTFFLEDRLDEYRLRLTDWAKKQTRRSYRKHPPDDLLPPVVDFEAIFIPDSPSKLSQIVPMLRYSDIDKAVLLGTNIWNTPNLPSKLPHPNFPAVFIDSYFADDQRLTNSVFWKEYFETFREEPTVFEIKAYDSGLLLRQLVLSGVRTRQDLAQRLRSTTDFPGAIGSLHLNASREFEGPLYALTVENNRISTLDPEKIRLLLTPPPEEEEESDTSSPEESPNQ